MGSQFPTTKSAVESTDVDDSDVVFWSELELEVVRSVDWAFLCTNAGSLTAMSTVMVSKVDSIDVNCQGYTSPESAGGLSSSP